MVFGLNLFLFAETPTLSVFQQTKTETLAALRGKLAQTPDNETTAISQIYCKDKEAPWLPFWSSNGASSYIVKEYQLE